MFKNFPIVLDVTKSHLNDMFQVSNNDLNTIKLSLSIKSDLLAFDLTGKTVRLAIKKPDGFATFQTGGVTDAPSGLCEFILDRQSYLVEGMHEAEVMIYQDEETVVVTQKFFYKVNRAIMNDTFIESTNEFPAINQAIQAGELLLGVDIPAMVTAAETAAEATEGALLATTATTNAKEAAEFAAGRVDTVINSANAKIAETETARLAANSAASGANTQGTYAKNQGDYAKERGEATNTAISDANLATTDANAAKNSANAAATHAQTQGDYAKVQGDYAKTQGEAADRARDSATQAAVNVEAATAAANEKAGFAQTQGDYAKTTADSIKTKWLPAVATFAAIATTYPSPQNGDTVMVTNDGANTGNVYRRENGAWIFTQKHSDLAITDIKNDLVSTNRQTQVINQGVSLLNGTVSSPVDIQIEGQTLIPLQNSNLIGDASYVLADKKTKVIVDNKTVPGVGKFKKNNTLTRKTNFVGKIPANNVENPNIAKWLNITSPLGTSLLKPTDAWTGELGTYPNISTLNGVAEIAKSSVNGGFAQTLFSFDLIAEVERNMGRIPGVDIAAKVQWLKDNVQTLKADWHGLGSSVGGNKSSLAVFFSGVWGTPNVGTQSVIAKQTLTVASGALNTVQTDGFVHFIAYAEPSDGVTHSTITTDFIELQIDLKSTAQLDTKPEIIRIANYEGKVTGSTVEVPHTAIYKDSASATAGLLTPSPSSGYGQFGPTLYTAIGKLDASLAANSNSNNGAQGQELFSFDVIAEVERNIGRIPRNTLAEKRIWIKENAKNFTFNWYGFGTTVGGNKASVVCWYPAESRYSGLVSSHSLGTVSKLGWSAAVISYLDDNGFLHFLAYTNPSDGVTASTINTDYVELEIELKSTAILHDPSVPLFEVPTADYSKILVDWNEAEVLKKYPKVTGVQHVQNPYVMAEGENLFPSIYELSTMNNNADKIDNSPYDFTVTGTNKYYTELMWVASVMPNTEMTLSMKQEVITGGTAYFSVQFYKADNTFISETYALQGQILNGSLHRTFTTPTDCVKIGVRVARSASSRDFSVRYTEMMLNLGPTIKPFVPRNPSYLFAQTKLAQIGDKKDLLYKQDGKWTVRKAIEKDIPLDSLGTWGGSNDKTGFKSFYTTIMFPTVSGISSQLTNFEGKVLIYSPPANFVDSGGVFSDGRVYVGVSDALSGMGETHSPSGTEVTAFFNGWQAKTVDANGKPTAWKSLGDGTDAPTQTLAYVSVNKAPNYTPYKLSYALTTPQNVDISNQVEGDIAINGLTQVELGSGVIVREKAVVSALDGTNYFINSTYSVKPSQLKNRVLKFIGLYKNGILDQTGVIDTNLLFTYGSQRIKIAQTDFDTTADYKVTYLVQDRDKFTVNPYNTKASYAKNVRSALDETVNKVENNTKDISILIQSMAEMYKRLKTLGG